MFYFWEFLLFLMPGAILLQYLRGKRIGDGSMLLLGGAFYCFLPFVVYGAHVYKGPGVLTWENIFEPLYNESILALLLFSLLTLSFLLGKTVPIPNVWRKINRPISPKIIKISTFLLFVLWFIFAYKARLLLFKGYSLNYDPSMMGPLATVNLISVLILLNIKQWRQCYFAELLISILLLFNSLLLLSMGGRMYVMIPIISLFLQYINTSARNVTYRAKLFFVLLFVIFILLAVGLWRVGLDLSMSTLLTFGSAESILTSISMAYMYSCGQDDLFNIPYNFLSTIINFIPSAIFPNKSDFMIPIDPTGECLSSPFGAVHLSVELLLNFGVLGSCIFMLLFSVFLRSLKVVNRNGWWIYYYVCGLLPFMFFRDGFQIFNKALIGSGILMAITMLILSRLRVGKCPT